MDRTGVSSRALGSTQLGVTSYPAPCSSHETGVLRQARLLVTCLVLVTYLVQAVAAGDLAVPNPGVGHVVINVPQPHL